jgi:hypothetical protein
MQINIKKKHIFGFSILGLFLTVMIAYATAPNPGHSWSEIGDFPSDCGDGMVVKGIGSAALNCVTDQSGGGVGGDVSWSNCAEVPMPSNEDIIGCPSGKFVAGMNMHSAGAGVYYPTSMNCCEANIS